LVERNEENVRAAFLPFLQSLLEIPDEDLQKLADLYPDLAPIVIGIFLDQTRTQGGTGGTLS
jgi:hypothetical protein